MIKNIIQILIISFVFFGCMIQDEVTIPPPECQFVYKFPNSNESGILLIEQWTQQAILYCSASQTITINFATNLPVGWGFVRDGGNEAWTAYLLLNGERQKNDNFFGVSAGYNVPISIPENERNTFNVSSVDIPTQCSRLYQQYRINVTFAYLPYGDGLISTVLWSGQQISIGLDICEKPLPITGRCIRSNIERVIVSVDRTNFTGCE